MDKNSLRILYKQKRLSLSSEQRKAFSASVCARVSASDAFANVCVIHLFLPIEKKAEVDTFALLYSIWAAGKKTVVSVSDFSNGSMEHFSISADTVLKENHFGIPEPVIDHTTERIDPKDIDMVIIPLLAYDQNGGRVGYGKGFYDRFLSSCKASVVRAGVSFFPPTDKLIEDISPDDIPLDMCFSPDKVFIFEKKSVF